MNVFPSQRYWFKIYTWYRKHFWSHHRHFCILSGASRCKRIAAYFVKLPAVSADSKDFSKAHIRVLSSGFDPGSCGSPGIPSAVTSHLITVCLSHMFLRQVSSFLSPLCPTAPCHTWKQKNIPHGMHASSKDCVYFKVRSQIRQS